MADISGVLSGARQILLSKQMTTEAMLTDANMRAANVALYRDYYDGDHELDLTPEMLKMLRLAVESGDNFNLNYCQLVIDTATDRIIANGIEADNDPATTWLADVLDRNAFDELQSSVHQYTLIDGDTFVMVTPDTSADPATGKPKGTAVITHELAYDGISGIIPIYKSDDLKKLDAVLKFWHIVSDDGKITDTIRLNIYFDDRIERYVSENGSHFTPYSNVLTGENPVDDWKDAQGNGIGIPFEHFRNRRRKNYGVSELTGMIGPQNALNRMVYDIVISSELTAFAIRYLIGAALKNQGNMPGVFLEIAKEGVDKDTQMPQVGTLEAVGPGGFVEAANWLIANMSKVSNTPLPDFDGGDNASGEALKARESRFIGKINRFETHAGSSWESVADLCWKIETAFAPGVNPPNYKRFTAIFNDPVIRSDKDVVDNALALKKEGVISARAALRIVAPVYGFDKAMIDKILAELADEAAQRAAELSATVPGFNSFQTPGGGENDQNSQNQDIIQNDNQAA